ncbi:MAG: hydrogenase maturation protease [Gemmatimonadaceae bacterium]
MSFPAPAGFGVEVLHRLAERGIASESVQLLDVGTGGIRLAQELLDRYDRLIIIDATTRGGAAGSLSVHRVNGVRATREIDMHTAVPSRALEVAQAFGPLPKDVYLVGCEPASVDELTMVPSHRVGPARGRAALRGRIRAAPQSGPWGVQRSRLRLSLQRWRCGRLSRTHTRAHSLISAAPHITNRGDGMRLAIAGKGGTGKTTIAGTLSRVLARQREGEREVLAIDADTNPNLASVLGIPADRAREIVGLPRTLMERRADEDGTTRVVFAADPEDVIDEFGVVGPDGVRLLVMGKVGHGGAG